MTARTATAIDIEKLPDNLKDWAHGYCQAITMTGSLFDAIEKDPKPFTSGTIKTTVLDVLAMLLTTMRERVEEELKAHPEALKRVVVNDEGGVA